MTKITRVEVIDENGRSYVNFEDDNDVSVSYQDDERTLKVFLGKAPPEQPITEEENDERLKNSLKLIDEYFEKNKRPTLQELFEDYFLKQAFNDVLSKDLSYQIIWIVRDFLPKEHDTNSYDWNRCIRTILGNLQ